MQIRGRLDRKGAADFLEKMGAPYSPKTLDKYRSTGQGPKFYRVLGRIYYLPADLETWVATRTHECNSTADYRGQRAA